MHPNQAPNYPPGNTPTYPPGAYPQHFPIYQAGMPHPYMPPTTPQYPQPGPAFMNMQIKQEPMWNQDNRYGMAGPSGMPGMPGVPTAQQHPHYGYPPMIGVPLPGIEIGGDARNSDAYRNAPTSSIYGPISTSQQSQQQPHPSTSLLAQHLSSAPLPPPPSQQQQSSQLSQLLQHPVYPPGTGVPGGPGSQQMQQQQQMVEQQRLEQQRIAQMQFEVLRQHQQQAAYQAQQEYFQQQQATRAAALQAEQAAAMAAVAAAVNSAQNLAPPPNANQGFPPSASSSHSAYSAQQRAEIMAANQMAPLSLMRESPHKEEDLEKFTTGELCLYGRELVNELNTKTSHLSFMLKKVMERKVLTQGENPNDLAARCKYNLQKMSEIRQIIEKRRDPNWKRLTGDDYIEMMLDDSELQNNPPIDEKRIEKRADLEQRFPNILSKTAPNEGDVWYQGKWISEELHKKYMRFDANKETLRNLATELKALSWKIDVTSPGHLKKVDLTKISKKKKEEE